MAKASVKSSSPYILLIGRKMQDEKPIIRTTKVKRYLNLASKIKINALKMKCGCGSMPKL